MSCQFILQQRMGWGTPTCLPTQPELSFTSLSSQQSLLDQARPLSCYPKQPYTAKLIVTGLIKKKKKQQNKQNPHVCVYMYICILSPGEEKQSLQLWATSVNFWFENISLSIEVVGLYTQKKKKNRKERVWEAILLHGVSQVPTGFTGF